MIESTIKREVEEEVGIIVTNKLDYLGSDAFIRVSGHHVVSLTFLAHWKSGKAKPLEDQEEVAWYSLKQLKELSDLPKYLQSGVALLESFLVKTS